MNSLIRAINAGKFAWEKYLNGKTWNGIMLRTQPLFCCYGQILLLTKNKIRLWKRIILFRLTRKHVV